MSSLTRRRFLQGSAFLPVLPALDRFEGLLAASETTGDTTFVTGVNYPWVAYGHDFGENAWGHDGVVTSGWTAQKYPDSQGFRATRLSQDRAHRGLKSLRIQAALQGGHPNRSQGEVYLDLRNHAPRGLTPPLDLTGTKVSCWLFLPKGSTGPARAPNGLQIFFKSQETGDAPFRSWYSPWVNLEARWENRWTRFTADLGGPAGFEDEGFNSAKAVVLGVKMAINGSSRAVVSGPVYLDDFTVETSPPVTFDFEALEVERDFAVLARALRGCGTKVVRVFVFCDGAAAPNFNRRGEVTGLDPSFFEDFDELLHIAERRGLLLLPVFLDFHWLDAPRVIAGVQVGGRAGVIRDPAKRQALVDRALIPIAERYADHPAIYAWEIINEPEWAMREVEKDFEVEDPVSVAEMQDFVRLTVDTLHSRTSHPVTVGSARRMWLSLWRDSALDLYQFHWYDHFGGEEPFPWRPVSELGLDRPCIVGEVPTASTQRQAEAFLQSACAGGYQGLLFWSYRAGDPFSNFAQARPGLGQWCTAPGCG